jgi:hypothetical protein
MMKAAAKGFPSVVRLHGADPYAVAGDSVSAAVDLACEAALEPDEDSPGRYVQHRVHPHPQ